MLSLTDLTIPRDCDLYLSVDTGTYMGGCLCAIARDYHCFVLAEFPNYRYVSDQIELNDLSVPEWAEGVVQATALLGGKPTAWADPNTQFRAELRRYGLRLLSNQNGPEQRTAIAREYFLNDRVHLAPWLNILPYELENARWPDEASASGRFGRIKKSDHTLVCLEHILSRRPRGTVPLKDKAKTWLQRYLDANRLTIDRPADIHLGNQ